MIIILFCCYCCSSPLPFALSLSLSPSFAGEVKESVPYFMACTEVKPDYQRCRACLGRAELTLGIELREKDLDLGLYLIDNAGDLLEEAMKGGHNLPYVHLARGNTLAELGLKHALKATKAMHH